MYLSIAFQLQEVDCRGLALGLMMRMSWYLDKNERRKDGVHWVIYKLRS